MNNPPSLELLTRQLGAIGGRIERLEDRINLHSPPGYLWRFTHHDVFRIDISKFNQSHIAGALREKRDGLKLGLEKVKSPLELESIQLFLNRPDWVAPKGSPRFLDWPPPTGSGKQS